MLKRLFEFIDEHDFYCFAVIIMLFVLGGLVWLTTVQDDAPTVKHYEPTSTPTVTPAAPSDGIGIAFIDGLPTAVLVSPTEHASSAETCTNTPTVTPTPEPTETPTQAPTATNTPVPTKKPTNTPKPTKTPTATPKVTASSVKAGTYTIPTGGHDWKPYARYTAITAKSSPQYKLQKIAKTDSNGLRYVTVDGVKRYCVALPVHWAGGTLADIGRCFDVVMENGATIFCVLGDVKKIEHSQNGEGKFGSNGELLEFQVDMQKLPDAVRNSGDISRFGGAFEGEAVKIIVYDRNILKDN